MINELKITKVTRRDILLSLDDIEETLSKYFKFETLPTSDGRFENMMGDYYQHRINNYDWSDDWFIEDARLNILDLSDKDFLDLCVYFVNPDTITDKALIQKRLRIINSKLILDGFEMIKSGKTEGGYDSYVWREFSLKKSRKTVTLYVLKHGQMRSSIPNIKYPCISLRKDNWDDFSFRTTFTFAFRRERTQRW